MDGEEDLPQSIEIPQDIEAIVYQKLEIIKDCPYGSSQQIGSAHFIMTGSSSVEVTESVTSLQSQKQQQEVPRSRLKSQQIYRGQPYDPYIDEINEEIMDNSLHKAYPSMKDIIGLNSASRLPKCTSPQNSLGYDNPRSARISHVPNSRNPSLTFSEGSESRRQQSVATHSSINNTNNQQEFFEVLDQNTLTTTMHQAHLPEGTSDYQDQTETSLLQSQFEAFYLRLERDFEHKLSVLSHSLSATFERALSQRHA
jgi:hypothetical protein